MTALKTLSLNLRGASAAVEEAGEDATGLVETVPKLREELKALTGVDIMLDEDELNLSSLNQLKSENTQRWAIPRVRLVCKNSVKKQFGAKEVNMCRLAVMKI